MRFEAPESRNRWDSPLFVIQVNDIFLAFTLFHVEFGQGFPIYSSYSFSALALSYSALDSWLLSGGG